MELVRRKLKTLGPPGAAPQQRIACACFIAGATCRAPIARDSQGRSVCTTLAARVCRRTLEATCATAAQVSCARILRAHRPAIDAP